MSTTSTQHDGGPAFPNIGNQEWANQPGMTLRQFYKGQVAAGFSARDVAPRIPHERPTAKDLADWRRKVLDANADFIAEQADALLAEDAAFAERAKGPTP